MLISSKNNWEYFLQTKVEEINDDFITEVQSNDHCFNEFTSHIEEIASNSTLKTKLFFLAYFLDPAKQPIPVLQVQEIFSRTLKKNDFYNTIKNINTPLEPIPRVAAGTSSEEFDEFFAIKVLSLFHNQIPRKDKSKCLLDACRNNQTNRALAYIEKGADVRCSYKAFGGGTVKSPILYACKNKNLALTHRLLEAGAKTNELYGKTDEIKDDDDKKNETMTPFLFATKNYYDTKDDGWKALIKKLADENSVVQYDIHGNAALTMALSNEDSELSQYFFDLLVYFRVDNRYDLDIWRAFEKRVPGFVVDFLEKQIEQAKPILKSIYTYTEKKDENFLLDSAQIQKCANAYKAIGLILETSNHEIEGNRYTVGLISPGSYDRAFAGLLFEYKKSNWAQKERDLFYETALSKLQDQIEPLYDPNNNGLDSIQMNKFLISSFNFRKLLIAELLMIDSHSETRSEKLDSIYDSQKVFFFKIGGHLNLLWDQKVRGFFYQTELFKLEIQFELLQNRTTPFTDITIPKSLDEYLASIVNLRNLLVAEKLMMRDGSSAETQEEINMILESLDQIFSKVSMYVNTQKVDAPSSGHEGPPERKKQKL